MIYFNPDSIRKRIISKKIGDKVKLAPKVSVVIPAFNVSEFIAQTLDSVFAQTFTDLEVIVVNDGSSDTEKLENILSEYSSKIIYISQTNGGAASARNTAIYFASGEFIAFLDGDDIWLTNKLELQVKFLQENNLDMTYCNALMFGEKPWDGKTFMEKSGSKGKVTPESLIASTCNVITSGTLVARKSLIDCGCFDEDRKQFGYEDFDLWVRLAKNSCNIDYQKDVLLKYRVVIGSLSGGSIARAERTIKALYSVKEKNKLTASEFRTWTEKMKESKAFLELEKSKLYMIKKEFGKSKIHLENANKFFKKTKYAIIIWLLRIQPNLVLKLFQAKRKEEFSFINQSNTKL